MSERTLKLEGWQPYKKPNDKEELKESRQLIVECVFSIHHWKSERLKKMGFPPQGVKLQEIYLEVQSRIEQLRSISLWRWPFHAKRWWDRRVNETACPKYAEDGVPKLAAITAGLYCPNPALFVVSKRSNSEKPLEITKRR